MRFLYLGDFHNPFSTEQKVSRALEAEGHEVIRRDEKETHIPGVLSGCRTYSPDVLLFAKAKLGGQFDWDPAQTLPLLEMAKGVVRHRVCWNFDLLNPGFQPYRYQWASAVSEACSLFCTTDGSIVKYLSNAKLLRQGAEPIEGRRRPEFECDVLWLGSLYGRRREEVEALNRALLRRLWVVPGGFYGQELADVIASARVVVAPQWPHYPGYWSNRIYEVAAGGGCIIHHPDEALLQEGWVPGYNFTFAGDIQDAIQCAKVWVRNTGSAQETGLAARKTIQQQHTYRHRVKELVAAILLQDF